MRIEYSSIHIEYSHRGGSGGAVILHNTVPFDAIRVIQRYIRSEKVGSQLKVPPVAGSLPATSIWSKILPSSHMMVSSNSVTSISRQYESYRPKNMRASRTQWSSRRAIDLFISSDILPDAVVREQNSKHAQVMCTHVMTRCLLVCYLYSGT